MLKIFVSLLLILLLVNSATAQIEEENVEILPFSQLHLESKLLRNTTIVISGKASNETQFYIFNSQEFDNWSNQRAFSPLFTSKLNGSFNLQAKLTLSSSESLHFIFHNGHSYSITVSYNIDSLQISNTDKSIFSNLFILSVTSIMILTRFNNRRKNFNNSS